MGLMRALYLPGPSYADERVRASAGWWVILEYQRRAIAAAGYDVTVAAPRPVFYVENPPLVKYLSYSLPYLREAEEYDLLVGAPSYGLLAFLSGTPAVAYVWNNADWWRRKMLEQEYGSFGTTFNVHPSSEMMNTLGLETAGHVIACSPFVKKTHAAVVPAEKISVAFWGVDSRVFTPPPEEPPGYKVLFVGGDMVRKGLHYLCEAWSRFKREGRAGELWIVSNVQEIPGLPETRLFGQVPFETMPELYRSCHVLVCPTLEDGIALTVQEGMASGLVPIATPDAAEVFEDGVSGLRVPVRDPQAIYDALVRLEDQRTRRPMAQAARVLAETQTWENTILEWTTILTSLWRGRGKPFESAMPWLRKEAAR